ncbi:MAG: hypothetical protein HPY67_07860 [Syntrophaceae bacterium]|nr:hypothetical protein [Syntrophaceae bacterium]
METDMSHRPSNPLGGNHLRRLLSEFRHMDELCTEMLMLCEARPTGSPFEEIVQDLPEASRAELQQRVESLRQRLRQILADRRIPVETQRIHAAHAVRVRLHLLEIALDDLRPERMRGYGALTPAGREELLEIIETLSAALRPLLNAHGSRQD